MTTPRSRTPFLLPVLLPLSMLLVGATACGGSEPAKPLAEKAEKLEIEKPKAAGTMKFTVDPASSTLGFAMDAPVEKIRGKVPAAATTGVVYADLDDITKSTALIHVDIHELELFQQVQGEDGAFGEEVKQPTQNEHARQWLEISEDVPEDIRKKNELIEFSLASIKDASAASVNALEGDSRTVTFTATGEFLLHQRKAQKDAKIEATFTYKDGKPVSVTVKTVEPLSITLDEYDVRPRKGFGVLAAKTLDALAPKVAKDAEVSVEFTATLDP
ncbi:MAG: hypothetical protein KC468_08105, partial [Myxococcales bacterium]|nr:hypothetical protein [Myxococcales bacterium]